MPLLLFVVLEELLATSMSSLSFLHGGTASSCVVLGVADTVIIPAVSCFRSVGDDEANALDAVKLFGG